MTPREEDEDEHFTSLLCLEKLVMSHSDPIVTSSTLSDLDHPPVRKTPALRPGAISSARRRSLRAQAHHLRPVVQIGQAGLTEGVIAATQAALEQHELIKVSINSESPTERKSGAQEIGAATGAHVIQVIGRVIVLFREAEKPKARQSKSRDTQTSRSRQRGQR